MKRGDGTSTQPSANSGRRKAATILDVAAEAGVSKSTVSNVVRGVAEIAPDTRERVLKAIEALDYRPNAIARQFVNQRTTTLGVLVGDLTNPYYARMAQVVERAAFRCGYTTMFCNIEDDDAMAAAGVESLLSQRVAGMVLLAHVDSGSAAYGSLQRAGVPIVFLGLSESWGDSVGPMDRRGARIAVNHLIELGHTRIAYVRTPLVERSSDRPRYEGYRDEMRRHGLKTLSPHLWTPGSDVVVVSRREAPLVGALTGPRAPTGLFASNDIGAVALIDACESAGLEVPGAISVVGFDDIAIAGFGRIALTTVSQPLSFQAEQAVSWLLERIEDPTIPPRHKQVPVELRVRRSTGPAPAEVRPSA